VETEIQVITIEEIEDKALRLRPPTNQNYGWIYERVDVLKPREAIAIKHDCRRMKPSGKYKGCALATSITGHAQKYRPDVMIRTYHLNDGRLAVACYAKEEHDAN